MFRNTGFDWLWLVVGLAIFALIVMALGIEAAL